jgi:hypothetical protein
VTRISFWQPAGEHERFASHAFDGAIGKQVPLLKGPADEDIGLCMLVAAEVAEDGTGVLLTIEVLGSAGPVFSPSAETGGMSFAFTEPDPNSVPRDPLSVSPPRISWKTS